MTEPTVTRTLLLLTLVALPTPTAAQPATSDTVATACTAERFRQFDFWLGRWRVGRPGAEPRGASEITRAAGGCALQERYRNAGGYEGTSLNFPGADGRWTQVWVDNGGLVLHLEGGLDAEGRMVLSGDRTDASGQRIRDRITWTARPDGTVLQVWDASGDGGATYRNVFTGVYVREMP